MYPEGTGRKGFNKDNPNYVPVLTTQPFHDTMMNLPRDGPCNKRYNADLVAWSDAHEKDFLDDNADAISKLIKICGFNFAKSRELLGKSAIWSLKAATDFLTFSKNEGIDVSPLEKEAGGDLSDVIAAAHAGTNQQRFGKKHQLIYWIGSFLEKALFTNLTPPTKVKKEKLE